MVSTRCTVSPQPGARPAPRRPARAPGPAARARAGPGPTAPRAPCARASASNGEPASDPATSRLRRRARPGGLGQPGRRRRLEPEGEEDDRRDAGARTASTTRSAAGDGRARSASRAAGACRPRRPRIGQRRLHVGRQRDRDGVHLGQQRVDVGEAGDVELRADRLRLGEVAAPDADELGGGVLGERGGVDPLRPEAGAEDAEAHGQTAPNWRSPASPSPGTM